MKKLFYISSIIFVSQLFCNTAFAYYSSEDFRTDIKSYIDYEKNREMWQDWRQQDKDTINQYNSQIDSLNRQADMNRLEQQYSDSQKMWEEQNQAIKSLQSTIVNQDASIAKSKEETTANCNLIKARQENSEPLNITQVDVDVCASYGVQIITDEQLHANLKAKWDKYLADKKKQQEDTSAPVKTSNGKSSKYTMFEIDKPAPETVEEKHKAGTYTIDEIMSMKASSTATTSVPIINKLAERKTLWVSLKSKIRGWFNF